MRLQNSGEGRQVNTKRRAPKAHWQFYQLATWWQRRILKPCWCTSLSPFLLRSTCDLSGSHDPRPHGRRRTSPPHPPGPALAVGFSDECRVARRDSHPPAGGHNSMQQRHTVASITAREGLASWLGADAEDTTERRGSEYWRCTREYATICGSALGICCVKSLVRRERPGAAGEVECSTNVPAGTANSYVVWAS